MTKRKINNTSTISFARVDAGKTPTCFDAWAGAVLTIVPILSALTVEGTGNDICAVSVLHEQRQSHKRQVRVEWLDKTGRHNGRCGESILAGRQLKTHRR